MNVVRSDSAEALDLVGLVMPGPTPDEAGMADAYAAIVWSCILEPGDGAAGALIGALGADRALQTVRGGASAAMISALAGLESAESTRARARWRARLSAADPAAAVDSAVRAGAKLVVPGAPMWPAGLADLGPHAPVCLWVRGDPGAVHAREPAVALVGARAATGYGEHVAGEMAAELSRRGVVVVSGAAYGIDGAAHRGALASGGRTIALPAGGVDRAYPTGHTRLLERIAESGAVISEVPCGSAPTKWRFLQRNRLIAALATGTIVVEAGWRSGSLNTAGHAATLGRPLGAVPGPVTSAASAGCHRLLREFDAQCITTADEAAELIGLGPAVLDAPSPHTPQRPPTDDVARVLDALSSRSWRAADDIARRCGMAPYEVEAHLGMLLLDGRAQSEGGGWRRATSSGGK